MSAEQMIQKYIIFCIAKGLELQGSISRNQPLEEVLGDIMSALHAKSFRAGVEQGYGEGYSYGFTAGQEHTNASKDPDGDYIH